jgi:hypothetical protein
MGLRHTRKEMAGVTLRNLVHESEITLQRVKVRLFSQMMQNSSAELFMQAGRRFDAVRETPGVSSMDMNDCPRAVDLDTMLPQFRRGEFEVLLHHGRTLMSPYSRSGVAFTRKDRKAFWAATSAPTDPESRQD